VDAVAVVIGVFVIALAGADNDAVRIDAAQVVVNARPDRPAGLASPRNGLDAEVCMGTEARLIEQQGPEPRRLVRRRALRTDRALSRRLG
jgi:hypothetical protein